MVKTEVLQALTAATGEPAMVGWRGGSGAWFAHCGGRQCEGSTPNQAIDALLTEVKAQVRQTERAAQAEIGRTMAARAALDGS